LIVFFSENVDILNTRPMQMIILKTYFIIIIIIIIIYSKK